jgi:hypothetical protein
MLGDILRQAVEDGQYETTAEMIRVIALTGCWRSEVISLRKSDALSHKPTFFSQGSSIDLNRQIAAVTTASGRDVRAPPRSCRACVSGAFWISAPWLFSTQSGLFHSIG